MTTMLDCIRKGALVGHIVLDKAKENTDAMVKILGDLKEIDKIYLIASGSSFNAANCAVRFMEKVSGCEVFAYQPNTFSKKSVYQSDAVYLFISQTGTSSLVKEQVLKVKEMGYKTISVTDDSESPIAKASDLNISIEVGGEEYGFRTEGFDATILTLQMIGLRIGLEKGKIDEEAYASYIAEGYKAVDHMPQVVDDALKWFEENKEDLQSLRSLLYYGGGELYGIAVEGALKLLEVPKLYLSFGFEAEDGIHGPCYAFNENDAILFLSDGKKDDVYARSMVSFSKNELGRGYYFGPNTIDEKDLKITPVSENFIALEYAPAVQVISYMMAIINNVEVLPMDKRVPHVSSKYFQTHNG
ncbi:MAG: SIS domain-containing protein [Erysipelotrichaceae bacterium]|nr:SIS domain-containing protein [Erysipelotrichaceae bacterium]MBQ1740801.1 SIS domain-containing protein [Erysipelotrichaceae bacterium]MBQ1775200.1 SIS domain-containing protein [Erysipelotrichaceae bacterium]MBQ1910767.1 SIS domain-containing protein [Erysipelotrichaceae bacterium]MBQ2078210.1 SIS domain-containing protein [Erysipelotrichaceae bacterium]